jgi:hypothetical protein
VAGGRGHGPPAGGLDLAVRDAEKDDLGIAAAVGDAVAVEQTGVGAGGEKGPVDAAAHAPGADQRDRGDRGDLRVRGLHPFQFPVEIPDGRLVVFETGSVLIGPLPFG